MTSPIARLTRPASWSIAAKLATAFVLTALLPMIVAGWLSLQGSVAAVASNEAASLENLASAIAGRLDQFIRDTRHLVSYLAWSEEVLLLTGDPEPDVRRRTHGKLERIQSANEDIELLMVLDRNGLVLASTKPQYVGRNLAFRDYFKAAIAGQDFISDLEIGTVSRRAGIYLSGPVRNSSGGIAGVVAIKMKGNLIASVVDGATRGSARTTFLVDANGIVIHHPDPKVLYRSLRPLTDVLQRQIVEEKRYGSERIESLDLPKLADAMLGASAPGHADFTWSAGSVAAVAGYAPMQNHDWVVAVTEGRESFVKPLVDLYRQALYSTALVGLIATALALLVARFLLRPINALVRSTELARQGRYDEARVPIQSGDELGRLAETFNTMLDGVAARERERDIFGRIVSPEVREKLLTGELALGGENRRVTVLFTDLRGFTTMSEKMSPRDVVDMLNEYITEMSKAIKPWGGYINNFIGDAIIVVFGAPVGRAESEWCAVASAFAMRDALARLNDRRATLGDPPLQSGIGIGTGKVVVGQIGSMERFLYTVIGDAVNVAARLEALTKEFDDNPVLCNEHTAEAVRHREDLRIDDRGWQHLKGRTEPVHVFALSPVQTVPPAEAEGKA